MPADLAEFFDNEIPIVATAGRELFNGPMPSDRKLVVEVPFDLGTGPHEVVLTTTLITGVPFSHTCAALTLRPDDSPPPTNTPAPTATPRTLESDQAPSSTSPDDDVAGAGRTAEEPDDETASAPTPGDGDDSSTPIGIGLLAAAAGFGVLGFLRKRKDDRPRRR